MMRASGRGRVLFRWAGAAAGAALLGIAACGGSSSQAAARDQATAASCDWYQSCGQIGAGKMFETRDSCNVQVRANWDQAWPAATCDGKINNAALGVCLDAIKSTLCGNGLDIVNTLANKCPQAKVCAGP